jgi:hypothetical protein
MKTLDLVYGLPGEGKSTLALELAGGHRELVVENDHFFEAPDGTYSYQPNMTTIAGWWCWSEAFRRLQHVDHVVVANTFYDEDVIIGYIRQAKRLEITPRFFRSNGSVQTDVALHRCVHNIPEHKFEVIKTLLSKTWSESSLVRSHIAYGQHVHIDLEGSKEKARSYRL